MPLNWKYSLRPTVPPCAPELGRLLALGLALAGCDEGTSRPREAACLRYCDKLDLCDARTDRLGCVHRCVEDAVRSDAYFEARARCAEARSCNVWSEEVDLMGADVCDKPAPACRLDDCTSDTLATTQPSAAERTYCARVASKLHACDGALAPVQVEVHCLALAPALSPTYLDAMESCIELSCDRVPSCVDAVGDRFNTDLTFTPSVSLAR